MRPIGLACLLVLLLTLVCPPAVLADDVMPVPILSAPVTPTPPGPATLPPAAQVTLEPPPREFDLRRPDDLLGQLRYDALYLAAAPARMGPLGWGLTAGTAAAIYFARDNRQAERDWWEQRVRSHTTDNISNVVRPYGNQFTPLAVTGAFLAAGYALGRPHEFETGVMLAESSIYTLALTSLGQFVLAEDRPSQGGANHYLDGHMGHGISGHSSAAAALAGPLNRQYLQLKDTDSDWLRAGKIGGKVVVYGLPVLVGLSRINGDSHYLWNVLGGWAIGYTVGELIPNAHEAKKAGRSWWISPVMDDKATGVAFQTTW